MPNALPKVTIVILSHRKQLVGQAEASARNQTYPNVQVVTQYDTDAWPTKLNEVVAIAKGEYIVVLCDDDVLAPTFVEETMAVALGSDADIVYTDRRAFYDDEEPSTARHFRLHGDAFDGGPEQHAYRITFHVEQFLYGSSLPMTCLMRKTLWDRLGGHDVFMPHSDTELWYRAVEAGAVTCYLPQPLFWYRYHAGQMSRQVATLNPALRAFHRKHFLTFGAIMAEATPFAGPEDAFTVPILAPEYRVGYKTAHFTTLTTLGLMATETHPLSDLAKIAIQLKQREAEQAVNAVVALALRDAGLRFEDGWRLNDQYDAVREVPNATMFTAPVLVPDTPTERVESA